MESMWQGAITIKIGEGEGCKILLVMKFGVMIGIKIAVT
jgi:hypothetical protein